MAASLCASLQYCPSDELTGSHCGQEVRFRKVTSRRRSIASHLREPLQGRDGHFNTYATLEESVGFYRQANYPALLSIR